MSDKWIAWATSQLQHLRASIHSPKAGIRSTSIPVEAFDDLEMLEAEIKNICDSYLKPRN